MNIIDWHVGFVSAMKLELIESKDNLIYDEEHHIANRAQRIDLLIIKKAGSPQIVNEIGEIFDKFNIVEYKSPEAELTIGDFYKTLSYTCIYLEELHKYDEYGRDAFTMTPCTSSDESPARRMANVPSRWNSRSTYCETIGPSSALDVRFSNTGTATVRSSSGTLDVQR